MAFIDYISKGEASDKLKQLYSSWVEPDGTLDNIVKIAGHNPDALDYHMKFYKAVLHGPSPLTRQQRELIALVVSAINHCHYWIHHHWAALRRIGSTDSLQIDEKLRERLIKDWRTADLCEFDRLMLAYAEKITCSAHTINQSYIDNLKAAGFTDHILHDIVQVTAYFAYVNRLADGLGVELESDR